MNAPAEVRNSPIAADVTVDLSAPGPEPDRDGPAPRVEVVQGHPHLSDEMPSLLRGRLRAAASILTLTLVLYLVRSFFLAHVDPVLRLNLIATLAILLGGLLLLSSRRPLSLRQLRGLELALFAATVAYIAVLHYRLTLRRLTEGDLVEGMATIKRVVHSYFTVLVIYGLFIPNTWRRSAKFVGAIAAVPIAVGLVLRLGHPELVATAGKIATFEQLSENALTMLIGIVIAVYGTHIINALRVEAFQARQLNQYRLKHRLGSGGMGEVYLAEHQLLKRPCAIKLIRPGRSADPKALARFEREVRSTAQLTHWNTVAIFDYGRTEDGTFYYVMEYLPGLNLADLVGRYGPLPPERAIYLLRQACGALREAHQKGLIHRDIKPANLFASRLGGLDDVTKLLDFGLVKPTAGPSSADLSQDGGITGSPAYLSPEQATGDRAPDRRSDIYSLGAVAYYLITGRAPFEGASVVRVLIAHARDPVEPPSRWRPEVPDDLERVVLRCLAKDPDDRFPDAESLERALASCSDADSWNQSLASDWWRHREAERPELAPAS